MNELPAGYRVPDDPEDLLDECDVTWFQASGPGGQHRNRTKTAVRLQHRPSGVVVIGRRERSANQNKKDALARLAERLRALLYKPPPRRPTKTPRAVRKKRVEGKRRHAEKKRLRGRVDSGD